MFAANYGAPANAPQGAFRESEQPESCSDEIGEMDPPRGRLKL